MREKLEIGRRPLLRSLLAGGAMLAAPGVVSTALGASALPKPLVSNAKAGGFSAQRLERLTRGLQDYIDADKIDCAIPLIHRHGQIVQLDVLGWKDRQAGTPLTRDSIFRAASMTKPIIAVATLMLIEEGKFQLLDPVDRWLPELANRKILKDPDGPVSNTTPSPRPITIEDLMTQRAGFSSGFAPASSELGALLKRLGDAENLDDFIKRLGQIPLVAAPGEQFIYGMGMDVLGALIARVSGMSLPDFLQTRIFGPLGMKDTAFWVPSEKFSRLVVASTIDLETGKRTLTDEPSRTSLKAPPKVPRGAGGLVTTVDDYLQFGLMLLHKGVAGDTRFLSRKTIDTMTANYLTPQQRTLPFSMAGDREIAPGFWAGQGYGLGVGVTDNLAGTGGPDTVGSYYWGGMWGTLWVNDPKEDMTLVLMTQTATRVPNPPLDRIFRTLVYQAMDT